MTAYAVVPVVTDSGGTVHYVRRPVALPNTHGAAVVLLTECGSHVWHGRREYRSPAVLTCGRCVRSLP